MFHQILCTSNFVLPQKVDLNSIRDELNEKKAAKKSLEEQLQPENCELTKEKLFDVLPLQHKPNHELERQLSLETNSYLTCKFNRFLSNATNKLFKVDLYKDIRHQREKPKPRPMKLTGGFYDMDNKLAPAPFIPDPRQYNKRRDSRKFSQKRNTVEITTQL